MADTEAAGTITLPANTYSKGNYGFMGWATTQEKANSRTVEYPEKATYSITKDATLYAVWTATELDAQADVVGSTTWDWADVTNESSVDFSDNVLKNVDVLYSNISKYGITAVSGLAAQSALLMNGQRAYNNANKSKHCQVNYLKFNTTYPGRVTVEYANTGGNAARTVNVNGTKGSESVTDNSTYKSESFTVTAGTVTIKGVQVSDDADKMLRIRKVVFTPVASVSGTISAAGWSTFSSPYPLDLSEAVTNGTVYFASASNGSTVTLEEAPAQVVPAGEGLMVKGTAGNTFTIQTAGEAGTAISDNLLKGQTVTGNVSAANHYVFGYVTENPSTYGFYALTAATEVKAGKAYLEYPAAMAPSFLRIVEGEQSATGVENIEANEKAVKFIENGQLYILRDGVVYDTVGRVIRK